MKRSLCLLSAMAVCVVMVGCKSAPTQQVSMLNLPPKPEPALKPVSSIGGYVGQPSAVGIPVRYAPATFAKQSPAQAAANRRAAQELRTLDLSAPE